MRNANTLQSWGRQAWWATLVGAAFLMVGYLTTAFTSWGTLLVLVGQVLLTAGVVGLLAYGWYAGLASTRGSRSRSRTTD